MGDFSRSIKSSLLGDKILDRPGISGVWLNANVLSVSECVLCAELTRLAGLAADRRIRLLKPVHWSGDRCNLFGFSEFMSGLQMHFSHCQVFRDRS